VAIGQPQQAHILLVEDDKALATMVADALRTSGHAVWHVERGADAEAAVEQLRPDVIVLDLMLPDRNGLVMCSKLKARAGGVPLLICSGTKRKDDPVLGLQLGADDFLHKPFTVDELQARILLALRRSPASAPTQREARDGMHRLGQLIVDDIRRRATMRGQVLALTPTEYRLLSALAHQPAEVLPRHELAERIWGYVDDGVIGSLDVHMRRLRAKLALAGPTPRLLTRRGFGYQLVDDSTVSRTQ
jgi:DNA-binding response OmpR family regulator